MVMTKAATFAYCTHSRNRTQPFSFVISGGRVAQLLEHPSKEENRHAQTFPGFVFGMIDEITAYDSPLCKRLAGTTILYLAKTRGIDRIPKRD